jgi:2-oxoglutarate ferredoxin oxidoreductase subunit gamma
MPAIMQVRLGGLGGQGIVLAGSLLGEAGVLDGKFAAGSNSYGAQARGSSCRADIVFSEDPIDYPHLTVVDIFAAYSQQAYDLYGTDVVAPSGVIVYDSGLVIALRKDWEVAQMGVAATDQAVQVLHDKQVANIVLIGALVEITGVVSPNSFRRAMRIHFAQPFRQINLAAFRLGVDLGRKCRG